MLEHPSAGFGGEGIFLVMEEALGRALGFCEWWVVHPMSVPACKSLGKGTRTALFFQITKAKVTTALNIPQR